MVPGELERINGIVDRLLELARPARLDFQPARLPELLDRALELYANELEAKGIEVRREYARDCPLVHGDREALYQAFVNLVTNAVDAMGAGDGLTLRVGWYHGSDLLGPPARRRRPARQGRDRGYRQRHRTTPTPTRSSTRSSRPRPLAPGSAWP